MLIYLIPRHNIFNIVYIIRKKVNTAGLKIDEQMIPIFKSNRCFSDF